MKSTLAAAVVLVMTGVIHSIAGEALWIHSLPRWQAPPLPGGSDRLAKQTIRATWHVASILAFGFAVLAWEMSRRPADPFVTTTLTVTLLASAFLILVMTRGKHPGWIAITAAAVLCASA